MASASEIEAACAVITLAACAIGQFWLAARRAGTVHQKLIDIERVVKGHDTSLRNSMDHERRIVDLESEIEPLKLTRDQFNELRGQSRAEHIAQNKTLDEIKAQLRDMSTSLGARLDGLQRQITNVVMGSADNTEAVSQHPRRRNQR